MKSYTSKKVINNTSKTKPEHNEDIDELDELDIILNSNKESKKTITIPNKQEIIKNNDIKLKLIDDSTDLFYSLELDSKPKNYGNRWSNEDVAQLIELLKKNPNKEINYNDIANKLGRSEGGVKGEIKKIILKRYLNGEDVESISVDMNIQYKFIKILIKTYIDNEIDTDINNLEKENKLLKLKMENMELRKTISKITNDK